MADWPEIVARLQADLQPRFALEVSPVDEESVRIRINGEWICDMSPPTPWNLVEAVQDGVSERVAFGEPWPPCPSTGTHPMNLHGDSWVCEEHDVRISLGSLNR